MKKYPDHETLERIAIAGYGEKMQSPDEKLGNCTNKADLDDWSFQAQNWSAGRPGVAVSRDSYNGPAQPTSKPGVSDRRLSSVDGRETDKGVGK